MRSFERPSDSNAPTIPPPGPAPQIEERPSYSDRPLSHPIAHPTVILVGDANGQDKRFIAHSAVDSWPNEVRLVRSLTDRAPRRDDHSGEFEYVTPEILQDFKRTGRLVESTTRGNVTYGRTPEAFRMVAMKYVGIAVMSVEGARQVRMIPIPCIIIYLQSPTKTKKPQDPPPSDLRVHLVIQLNARSSASQSALVQVRRVCTEVLRGFSPTSSERPPHTLPPVT